MEKPRNWHAIYVKSRTEKKVMELLQERSIDAYVPIVKTLRQWSDRKKKVELPLLHGYVFVNVEPKQHEQVLQTRGVVSFVRSEGKIAIIRQVEIDRLKQLEELGYQMEAHPLRRNYEEGDKIKITSGPLKGLEGFVMDSAGQRSIEVLLESIGHSITVRLPQEILIRA
jgi:transcription antitermination factor NusG